MVRTILLLLVGCLLGGMGRGMAMMAMLPDLEMVGASDLVIVGTVLEDQRVEAVPGRLEGRAVIRVDRVLKGEAAGELVVYHAMPPQLPPGMIVMDHGGIILQPQSQWLFFLQRYPGGYTLTGGMIGRRPVEQEAHFVPLVKNFPVQVTLSAPVGPFYFDRKAPVTITVRNLSDAPVKYYQPRLEGLYYSPRFGSYIIFRAVAGGLNADVPAQPDTLEAKGERMITLPFFTAISPAWQAFTPDSYLLTPIFVRARLTVELPGDPHPTRINAASPWLDTLTGFPPPGE